MGHPWPSWDSSIWQEDADKKTPWRARLRKAQGRYRETVLGLPPGERGVKRGASRSIVSDLPEYAVRLKPELNFLEDPSIEQAAHDRLQQRGWRGIINEDRLYRNMLTSQTLCFNLFVPLSRCRDALSSLLNDRLSLNVRSVDDVRIEWAPQLVDWKSGSAFDAFIGYTTNAGEERFLGVECKYAEYLREQRPVRRQDNPVYWTITEQQGSGFLPGAADELNSKATCQLWYNSCLALKMSSEVDRYTGGMIVMMSCRDDQGAREAVKQFGSRREQEGNLLRHVTYEDVVDRVQPSEELREWAGKFTRRYLSFDDIYL